MDHQGYNNFQIISHKSAMYLTLPKFSKFILIVFLCILSFSSTAQDISTISLNIGDPAPELRVSKWLKGTSIHNFEKGKFYVLEFWASWCQPCRAAIPRLSLLAHKYKNRVNIIGVNVLDSNSSKEKLRKFVETMGNRMNYAVAIDSNKFMEKFWYEPTRPGLPGTIIINAEGKVAWIGYPWDLDGVISKVINGKWDIEQAFADRKRQQYLTALTDSVNIEVIQFIGRPEVFNYDGVSIIPEQLERPDSTLLYMNKIIQQEPLVQNEPTIIYKVFNSLLQTDLDKAYLYGKKMLTPSNRIYTPSDAIKDAIAGNSLKRTLPTKFYKLGIKASKMNIKEVIYPENENMPRHYHELAWMYWLSGKKRKAIKTEKRAIHITKERNNVYLKLDEYKAKLKYYKIERRVKGS